MKQRIQPIIEKLGKGKPVIGIVGAMHGNESGPAIIKKLKSTIQLQKGTVVFIIANTKAREQQVRFIDEDLNRAFPGQKDGNHEQQLAYELMQIGKELDFLIDLHSCSMESAPFAILRTTGKDMKMSKASGLPFLVVYPLTTQGGGSFIDYVPCGIGFELGKHNKKSTIEAGFQATLSVLGYLGFIEKSEMRKGEQRILRVTGHLTKEKGLKMNDSLSNFKLVKKGEVIGIKNKKEIRAEKDFYPILYKEKAYTTNLGWMGEEIRV